MKRMEVNSVVTHRLYRDFVGVVMDTHPKFGCLIGLETSRTPGVSFARLAQVIVSIEDAAAITNS